MRAICFPPLLLISLLVPACTGAIRAEDPRPTPVQIAACDHYEDRALLEPQGGEDAFAIRLAEACRAAGRTLEAGSARQKVAAAAFLDRLGELYSVVIAMNASHDGGPAAGPDALSDNGAAGGPGQVSDTGEFLIAHRLGLIAALDDWVDSGARFSVALR
jgi:hypothetical protein